jgi:hypothetical protein
VSLYIAQVVVDEASLNPPRPCSREEVRTLPGFTLTFSYKTLGLTALLPTSSRPILPLSHFSTGVATWLSR